MKKRMERNKRIKRNTKKNYICLYIYIYNACTDGKNFFHHGMPLAQPPAVACPKACMRRRECVFKIKIY